MKCFIFEEMKIVERKQNRQWITLLPLIFFVFSLFTACTSKKKILYFNEGSFVSTPKAPQPLKCQRGDILDIKVYSVNAGVVAPFNQFLVPSANGEEMVLMAIWLEKIFPLRSRLLEKYKLVV